MFYSQLLFSKKGALATIWISAHCHKRLKKDQVKQTDICSSVDKILVDEVPVVTYRILAYLLLGVVRIYSKKVEYLFHDCQDILNKLCDFKIGKRTRAGIGVSRKRNHSITLPKRFELDAFDLELMEDRDVEGENVRSREDLTLSDRRIMESTAWGLLYKNNVSFSETFSKAHTPPRGVFSPHHMDRGLFTSPSCNINNSAASLEMLRGPDFSLEDRLDLTALDEAEKEQMLDMPINEDLRNNVQGLNHEMKFDSVASPFRHKCGSVLSSEMHRGTGFSLDARLDPLVLDEAEKEQILFRSSIEDLRTNVQGLNHEMDFDSVTSPFRYKCGSVLSSEMLRGTGFSLGDRLDPLVLDEDEKEQILFRSSNEDIRTNFWGPAHDIEYDSAASPSHNSSDLGTTLEVLHGSCFSLEHYLGPIMLNEDEKGQYCEEPSDKDHGIEEDHMEHLRNQLNFQEDVSGDFNRAIDAEKKKFVELIIPQSQKYQRMQEQMKPMSVDVTPDSKLPGIGTPEVVSVQTPAPKEHSTILKKRKTLLDHTTLLPNKVYKDWLDDPNELVRKRRKAPHTLLQTWRANKFCNIPQSFLEPLILRISVNLGPIDLKKKTYIVPIEPVELSASEEDVRCPIMFVVQEQIRVDKSPVKQRSHEQAPIAPETPVTLLNTLRSCESGTVADSDILEPTSSLESMEKQPSLDAGLELDCVFLDEETNSYERDSPEKDVYSVRTRLAGRYLQKNFLNRKKQEENEVLNLSWLLAGKAKKESARLFYEILVLKTGDYLDVKQDKAFDDILLQETSKLKLIAGTDGE